MWKNIISGYLRFTKRERTGIIALISLIAVFLLLPLFFPYFSKQKSYDHKEFEKAIASLQLKQQDSPEQFIPGNFKRSPYQNYQTGSPAGQAYHQAFKGELFYFDPNLASASDWKRLGIRDKTIATIQNYLSKGGKFYKKEDISKIWGLHEDEVARITPYIKIETKNSAGLYAAKKFETTVFDKKEYKKPIYKINEVDINKADTTAFIALPGIGSKLSLRIISFRDKLGGFYKVEQIGETFGLPDSTFQKLKGYLKIGGTELRRININTANLEEMISHPYLRYPIANAIIQYRMQHGNYSAVADIKKLMTMTEEVFSKIAPYLTVN